MAVSLVLLAQFLSGSVIQSINAAVFTSKLISQLASGAGLDGGQIEALLRAGTARVRETVQRDFPERLENVLGAYNSAITTVFVSLQSLVESCPAC